MESVVIIDIVVIIELVVEGGYLGVEKNKEEICVFMKNISFVMGSLCIRIIGVGSCGIMDFFCNRCDNFYIRFIGVGSGNILVDVICDRCFNKKIKLVGISSDIIEIRTFGVSECCIIDNYCDRCMNIRI